MKKILLGLNAVALPLATVATVVSCNNEKPKTPKKDVVITKPATLEDLQAAMLANADLKEDLSILAKKNLSNIHAIKAVLKDSMNRYSKREEDKGAKRKFTFDTIIDSMQSCEYVKEKDIEVLKMYFDKAKTEEKTLSVKGLTPSIKEEGTLKQFSDALKAKQAKLKASLDKALIIGDDHNNNDILMELILLLTLSKKYSYEEIIERHVTAKIEQTADKKDFTHAKLTITMMTEFKPVYAQIIFNKLELQTKQVSSSLKKAIESKIVAFNKETSKLTKEEITNITKIQAILKGLKMNEFGKTYESIINQISKSEFTLNAKSKNVGTLKLTFIGQDNITIQNVEVKSNTSKTK